jgi:hypothetical protein
MVSRFETGACLPTPAVLEALESILDTSRYQLYSFDDLRLIDPYIAAAMEGAEGERVAAPLEPEPLSPREQAVLRALPYGHDNAISRERLSRTVHLPDRGCREIIERLRRKGFLILSRGANAGGYYQSNNIAEIEAAYWPERHRALSVLARLKAMRRILTEAGKRV